MLSTTPLLTSQNNQTTNKQTNKQTNCLTIEALHTELFSGSGTKKLKRSEQYSNLFGLNKRIIFLLNDGWSVPCISNQLWLIRFYIIYL